VDIARPDLREKKKKRRIAWGAAVGDVAGVRYWDRRIPQAGIAEGPGALLRIRNLRVLRR